MKQLLIMLILTGTAIITVAGPQQDSSKSSTGFQSFTVTVTKKGYRPNSLKLKADVPARITFIRKTDQSCATEVIIPKYSINQKLPLNEPVVVEFTPRQTGDFKFACGMDMNRGKLIVRR